MSGIVLGPVTRQAGHVRLREWDPGTAPPVEIDAWLRAYNESLAADLPEDPQWSSTMLREYLTVTMPGERRLTWLAEDDDGTMLGYGRLLILSDLGVLELYVTPGGRNRGVGRALLTELATICADRGYARMEWWVLDWNEPAHRFYRGVGAEPQDDWTVWRVTDESLKALGSRPK